MMGYRLHRLARIFRKLRAVSIAAGMISGFGGGFAQQSAQDVGDGTVSILGPSEQTDLRRQGEAALLAGNHTEMARVFGLLGNASNAQSDDLCWLGHAHQLLGNWPAASQAYAAALAKMDDELAVVPASTRPSSGRSREDRLQKRSNLILILARIHRHLLDDPGAAAKTYAMVTNHSVMLSQPLDDLATQWETRRLAMRDAVAPAPTPSPVKSDLQLGLLVLHELANTQERSGDFAGAFETLRRIQLTTYALGIASSFPYAINRILRELPAKPSDVPPGIIQLSAEEPSFTFDLQEAATQSLSIARYKDYWTFCLAPPAGMEFTELAFACDIEQSNVRYGGQFECWTMAYGDHPGKIKLGGIGWPRDEEPGRAVRSRKITIKPGVGEVYFKSGTEGDKFRVHQVKVSAKLRARQAGALATPTPPRGFKIQAKGLPEGGAMVFDGKPFILDAAYEGVEPGWHMYEFMHESSGRVWSLEANFQSGATYGLFINLDSPLETKLTNLRRLHSPQASLAKRIDGRWMLAWGSGTIHFAESEDLVAWSEPWQPEESDLFKQPFQCSAPSLFCDTDGRLWLAYFSNRLDLDQKIGVNGHRLFLSSYDDDRQGWSPPRPLSLSIDAWPLEPVQMSRDPEGTFRITHRLRQATAESPDRISSFSPLSIAVEDSQRGLGSNSHLSYAAEGGAHLVWEHQREQIFYSRRGRDGSWTKARNIQGIRGTRPRLIADGNRALVVYEQLNGDWMAPLRLDADELQAGPPVMISGHIAPLFSVHASEGEDGWVTVLCGADTVWVRSAQRGKLFKAFFPETSP